MPKVAIQGVKVHYQQYGVGPDLVLVHGLFCNLAFWYMTVVPALAEHFRVTVYDLKGHGFSGRTTSGYRAIDLAEDLKLLLDHLDIRQYHLAGHSFGGAIALAHALRYPVRSLFLADAWIPALQRAPLGNNPWRGPRGNPASAQRVEIELPRVAAGILEEWNSLPSGPDGGLLRMFSPGGSGGQSLVLKRWMELVQGTSAAAEFDDAAGLTRSDISHCEPPTAAAFGSQSKYLPTLRGLEALLPRCRSILVPGAGHFFPLSRPRVFTESLVEFTASAC